MRWFLLLTVVATMVTACMRGDKKKCEEATRNVFTLTFWHNANKQIAAAPPEKQAALRAELSNKLQQDLALNLESEASKCIKAGDNDRADCMIKAQTCDEAKKCMPKDAYWLDKMCK